MRQYGQAICDDPMHWLFGPWNGVEVVLCDFYHVLLSEVLNLNCVYSSKCFGSLGAEISGCFVFKLNLFLCSFFVV